jgi:hypothetical protein
MLHLSSANNRLVGAHPIKDTMSPKYTVVDRHDSIQVVLTVGLDSVVPSSFLFSKREVRHLLRFNQSRIKHGSAQKLAVMSLAYLMRCTLFWFVKAIESVWRVRIFRNRNIHPFSFLGQ